MPQIERDFPADLQIPATLNMASLRREASQAGIELDTRRYTASFDNDTLADIYRRQADNTVVRI